MNLQNRIEEAGKAGARAAQSLLNGLAEHEKMCRATFEPVYKKMGSIMLIRHLYNRQSLLSWCFYCREFHGDYEPKVRMGASVVRHRTIHAFKFASTLDEFTSNLERLTLKAHEDGIYCGKNIGFCMAITPHGQEIQLMKEELVRRFNLRQLHQASAPLVP